MLSEYKVNSLEAEYIDTLINGADDFLKLLKRYKLNKEKGSEGKVSLSKVRGKVVFLCNSGLQINIEYLIYKNFSKKSKA